MHGQYGCGTGKSPGDTLWDRDDYLRAGFIADGAATCHTGWPYVTARSFVQLNLGGLEGANIMSASLSLAVASNMSCSGSNNVVHAGEINGGMSFNHGPAWWVPFASVSGCPSNVEFDVKGLVTAEVNGGSSTFTFGLISPNENDSKTWKRYNRDVAFAVTYNKAPNDPRNLQFFNGTKGFPCVSGVNRPVVGRTSTGYIAKANVSDPDGGMLYAGFRVYKGAVSSGNYTWDGNEAGTDNVPSSNNANNQNAAATLPSATLNADGIYSIDVHATDGVDTVWSSTCEVELELSAPAAPVVVSDSYPPGTWGGAPGQVGQFTFTASGSPSAVHRPPVTGRPTPAAVLGEAAAGMRWLWRSGRIRTVILTGAGLAFFTQTWEPLLVLISAGPTGVSAAGFGVILAVGAIVTPALIRRFRNESLQIAALGSVAIVDCGLAAYPEPVVAALTLCAVSFAFAVWNVLSITMRQRLVPGSVLGRVNAASRTLSMTAGVTGTIAGGVLAAWLGLSAPLWISAAALAVITVLFAVSSQAWRREN